MELQTVVGYLAALAVPLWLLAEQALSWRRQAHEVEKQSAPAQISAKPVSSPIVRPGRAPALRMAQSRKTA